MVLEHRKTLGATSIQDRVKALVSYLAPLATGQVSPLPGRQEIVFLRWGDVVGIREIWAAGIDEPQARRLTDGEEPIGRVSSFSLSPEGKRLVVTMYRPPVMELVDLSENRHFQIADEVHIPSQPVWSRDGEEIFYLRAADSFPSPIPLVAVCSVNLRSGQRRELVAPHPSISHLVLGPDGQSLAYRIGRGGIAGKGSDTYALDIGSGRGDCLLEGFGLIAWSPNGQWLLAEREFDIGGKNVWVFAADGSQERKLTPGSASESALCWFPDSLNVLTWSRGVTDHLIGDLWQVHIATLERNRVASGISYPAWGLPTLTLDGERVIYRWNPFFINSPRRALSKSTVTSG